MQPDNQNNYFQKDPETDESTGIYTPEAIEDYPESNPDAEVQPAEALSDNEPVHWEASEYIHEEKNALWFIAFAVVCLLLIALDIFFMHSYTFSALVAVMAVTFVIYTRRPPRIMSYTLSIDQGLYVGEKLYHFSEFKSFGLIDDHNQHSIMLIPIKRFALGVSVYFPDEVGEKVVDILGARLPMEDLKLDVLDNIVRTLHL